MDYKKNREIFNCAINSGCRTAAQFALYLKAREYIFSI